MKIAKIYSATVSYAATKACNVIGHSWRYKDYSNFIKPNGEKYDFTVARWCSRCHKRSYYNGKWLDSNKSKLDFVSDAMSVRFFTL
jgi:hypothetical protein